MSPKRVKVIDRVSAIDPSSGAGKAVAADKPTCIEFQSVDFAYPTRPDLPVFHAFNLVIEPGKSTALVGPSGTCLRGLCTFAVFTLSNTTICVTSGSGKSSIVSLIERFYDPLAGHISVDGVDLRELNVHAWRQRIGLVSQEPVLFNASVRDNILLGSGDKDVTEVRSIMLRVVICHHTSACDETE